MLKENCFYVVKVQSKYRLIAVLGYRPLNIFEEFSSVKAYSSCPFHHGMLYSSIYDNKGFYLDKKKALNFLDTETFKSSYKFLSVKQLHTEFYNENYAICVSYLLYSTNDLDDMMNFVLENDIVNCQVVKKFDFNLFYKDYYVRQIGEEIKKDDFGLFVLKNQLLNKELKIKERLYSYKDVYRFKLL